MTVVVAYKWAANLADASVRPDGTVDLSRAHPAVSEDDPVALALGRSVADAAGVGCVGVSVGPASVASPTARKAALARGLDRALVVADDATSGWNLTDAGAALAALVGRVPDARLVVTGEASVDENARMVPALMAGFLGWLLRGRDRRVLLRPGGGWSSAPRRVRTVEVAGSGGGVGGAGRGAGRGAGHARGARGGPQARGDRGCRRAGGTPVSVVEVARSRIERRRAGRVHEGPDAADALLAALRAEGVLWRRPRGS